MRTVRGPVAGQRSLASKTHPACAQLRLVLTCLLGVQNMRSPRIYFLFAALMATSAAVAQRHEHGGTIASEQVPPGEAYARGLHLLHNFEYDRALAAFRQARAADPGNVMAAWGEAMGHNHPLWMEVDVDAGRAALTQLGATPAERRAKAKSDKERMWLDAIEALYLGPTKIARDQAYNRAMEAMYERFPDDIDVRSFTALSVMGLAHNGREIVLYMRAAAMLEEAFPANPAHPGVLHYLIHAYDDPDHAPLGLRAARLYAAVAPDAGHAMHMTSHIYLALGLWLDVERTNVLAMGIVNTQRAAGGKPSTSCGHYAEWMVYALLQQGREPAATVDSCRVQVERAHAAGDPAAGRIFGSWADMAARVAVETGRPPTPPVVPASVSPLAHFWTDYARMIGDGPRQADSRRALASSGAPLISMLTKVRPDDSSTPRWVERAIAHGEALSILAEGKNEQGLTALRAAADAERALPVEFGPPALPKPSIELLADQLLKLGRYPEAAAAYRATLAAAPGRRRALTGLQAANRGTP